MEHLRLQHHILHLAAIRACVHAQGAADGAGNAAQEFEPAEALGAGGKRDVEIESSGSGFENLPLRRNRGERPAQADDHTRHAAVAHQEVGADTDHGHRDVGRLGSEKG